MARRCDRRFKWHERRFVHGKENPSQRRSARTERRKGAKAGAEGWAFGIAVRTAGATLTLLLTKGRLALVNRIHGLFGLVLGLGVLVSASSMAAADAGPSAPESFQIRNKKYGDLLRPEDANSATGTRIVLYPAQSWKCLTWKLHPAGDSVFQAQNHFTSKTFEAAGKAEGAQTPVLQVPFAKDAKERPTWRFTKLPDGLYQIVEVKSGKALTAVPDGSGARIVVAPLGSGDDQKWELIKTDPSKLTM